MHYVTYSSLPDRVGVSIKSYQISVYMMYKNEKFCEKHFIPYFKMDIDGLFISSYDGCHIMFTPFIDQDFISKLLRNTKLICDIFLEYVSAHVWLNVFWIIKRMHHSILYKWSSMTWRKLNLNWSFWTLRIMQMVYNHTLHNFKLVQYYLS